MTISSSRIQRDVVGPCGSNTQSTKASSDTPPAATSISAHTGELRGPQAGTAAIPANSTVVQNSVPEARSGWSTPNTWASRNSTTATSARPATSSAVWAGAGCSSSRSAAIPGPNTTMAASSVRTSRTPRPHTPSKRTLTIRSAIVRGMPPAATSWSRSGSGRRNPTLRAPDVPPTVAIAAQTTPPGGAGPARLGTHDAGVLDRRVAGVVVEAHPALAAVPPRGQHLAQDRRLREALLPELLEHHVADRAQRVQADEVRQRQRPHRVAGARLHGLVDLGDRAHALLVGPHAVQQEGDEQPVDDEPGGVAGWDGELAQGARELEPDPERVLRRGDAADHLD